MHTPTAQPFQKDLPSMDHCTQLDLFWSSELQSQSVLAAKLWHQQEGILARSSTDRSVRRAAALADRARARDRFTSLSVDYPWQWPVFNCLCQAESEPPQAPGGALPGTKLQALSTGIARQVATALSAPFPVSTGGESVRVEFPDCMAWVASKKQRSVYLEVRDAKGDWQLSQLRFDMSNPLNRAYWIDQVLLAWLPRIEQAFGERSVDAHWRLRFYLERMFHDTKSLRAASRQIRHHIEVEPALSGVIRQIRQWSPDMVLDNHNFSTFWQEAPEWTRLSSRHSRLLHLYHAARCEGLLETGAGLSGLRTRCLEKGLSRGGWRFLNNFGDSAYSALAPQEGDEASDPMTWLAYIDWQVRAGLNKPLEKSCGSALQFYDCIEKGEDGRSRIVVDPRLARVLQQYLDRLEATDGDDEGFGLDWLRVLSWIREHQPVFDRNQWRAGWPAIVRAYENWLRQQPDRLTWRSPVDAFSSGGWRIRPLTGSSQLAVEGMRMKHCVGTYASRCHEGGYLVFSVENEKTGEPAATIGLEKLDRHWQVEEVKGKLNRDGSPEMHALAQQILDRVSQLDES